MGQPNRSPELERIPDRRTAGRLLALQLAHLKPRRPLVIALPRGGVPVAHEIARALDAPLSLLVAKKLGSPDNPELAIGALTSTGALWLNHSLLKYLDLPADLVDESRRNAQRAIARQADVFRELIADQELIRGRTVVLVDDGFATGATVFAAIDALRAADAEEIVLAVPVISPAGLEEVRLKVEEVHSLLTPEPFYAVAPWYEEFPQVTDEEVLALGRPGRTDHAHP